jgi:hypothetical protein
MDASLPRRVVENGVEIIWLVNYKFKFYLCFAFNKQHEQVGVQFSGSPFTRVSKSSRGI